uniref:Reverse transcriptase N-terminal domain-containing protein n=1 Tax=Palisada sp. TaxID=1955416 RepID=A0A1Z1MRH3_9FLOR|nr:hypothetical protein [Palisada sp.]
MIQKQIYVATKKYNIYYVYELQKYLINSNEAKLISIKDIIDLKFVNYIESLNHKSYIYECRNYDINKTLFNKYLLLQNSWLIINQKVKQNLVYLSTLPMCKAKLKEKIFRFFMMYQSTYFSYFNIRLNKFRFTKIIINKLQASKYIKKSTLNWVFSEDIYIWFTVVNISFQQCLIYKLDEFKTLYIGSRNLFSFMSGILFLDRCWYCFRVQLKKYRTKNLKKTVYGFLTYSSNIHINRQYINITKQLKVFLHQRKQKRFNTINILSYKNKFIDNLLRAYLITNRRSKNFIFYNSAKFYNQFLNLFLYNYHKKRNYANIINMQNTKILKLNYSINLYIYYYNIVNFYIF